MHTCRLQSETKSEMILLYSGQVTVADFSLWRLGTLTRQARFHCFSWRVKAASPLSLYVGLLFLLYFSSVLSQIRSSHLSLLFLEARCLGG